MISREDLRAVFSEAVQDEGRMIHEGGLWVEEAFLPHGFFETWNAVEVVEWNSL